MGKDYEHLKAEERAVLFAERCKGRSFSRIGELLGRDKSTMQREWHRGGGKDYEPTVAAAGYTTRRQRSRRPCKLIAGEPLHRHVQDQLLYKRHSPQQIAARLQHDHPQDPAWQVSHETIYASIYAHPRGSLKQGLIAALRQQHSTRGRRRTGTVKGATVPEFMGIVHRPEEVAGRLVPGHWEGDFIKGAYNRSGVGTVVERKSRYVVLCKMQGCTSAAALEGFTRQLKKVPSVLMQTFTYDRGTELSCHAQLAKALKVDIYFADPHAPWQRGSNENTNGLLRQFLPKGTDLSTVSQMQLNDIATLLNERPRKTLGWKTPKEVFAEELAKFSNPVALDT